MNHLITLFEKLGSPVALGKPSDADWHLLEIQLRIILPDSYKKFISMFGSGMFLADIFFLNPASSNIGRGFDVNTLHEICMYFPGVKYYNDFHNFKIYPDINGLIPVGCTGLPKFFFLNPADDGIVFIDLDDYRFACFDGGIDELLLRYIYDSNSDLMDPVGRLINDYKQHCILDSIPFFKPCEF